MSHDSHSSAELVSFYIHIASTLSAFYLIPHIFYYNFWAFEIRHFNSNLPRCTRQNYRNSDGGMVGTVH